MNSLSGRRSMRLACPDNGRAAWDLAVRLAGAAIVAVAVTVTIAGCADVPSDYDRATLIDPSGILNPQDAAAVRDCAADFGGRTDAERVAVVLSDEAASDSATVSLARNVFDQIADTNQLVLIENVTTRYVWAEVGGAIGDHIGGDVDAALIRPHHEDLREGPRQGICAILAEATAHVVGWKRIPAAGWAAGLTIPPLAAAAFCVFLLRSYRLRTARHVYDIRLAQLRHLEASDTFVRQYQTRVTRDSGGPGGGPGGGRSRSHGGGSHF
jgi:hypothetical protein